MDSTEDLELKLKELIIEALVLEDLTPQDIQSEEPLFGEGLGLDSIDALEIAMVIEQQFGVTIDEDPDANQERFASVRSLASFVAESLKK